MKNKITRFPSPFRPTLLSLSHCPLFSSSIAFCVFEVRGEHFPLGSRVGEVVGIVGLNFFYWG